MFNRVLRVINATRQTVAGELWKIGAEFGSANDDVSPVVCVVEIWSRAWLKSDEYTMRCENAKEYKSRNKRSLLYDSRKRQEEYGARPISPVDIELEQQFSSFVKQYNRKFNDEVERNFRQRIFSANLARIEELNRREQGTATYGVNQFADMTEAEFSKYKGLLERSTESNELRNPLADIPDKLLPKSFDWRDKNVVSQVDSNIYIRI